MSILSNRLEAIIREMVNLVVRSSRSAAITNARDLSCGLLTFDHRLICVEESMPIHVSSLELSTEIITKLHRDIEVGDAFLNNSAYYGGTHAADLTVCIPVFFDDVPMFWVLARSHHADIGAHIPSAIDPFAATVYEEGLHFPCMRIQRDGEDIQDLVRFCEVNIRSSTVWRGDYRAQIGACRVAERRLIELCRKYGREMIVQFIEDWIEYGRRRASHSIAELPAGTWQHTCYHDPIPKIAEDPIPITAAVTINPERGEITVDLRDNPDCIAAGINLSEACATAACRIGVFNNLDSTIPHNAGSASRIKILLRDNCIVGRPRYPAGTSNATMGVNDRLINAVQCCFAQLGMPHGMAEGGVEYTLGGGGSISGLDTRVNPPTEYVNSLILGLSGGPGVYGHDGWLTYEAPNGGGVLAIDSVEVDESLYPLVVETRRIAKDALGSGRWNGAPPIEGSYRPLSGPMLVSFSSDGEIAPAKGVLGGLPAAPSYNQKRGRDSTTKPLPAFGSTVCESDELLLYRCCGGGGYGPPDERDPERVATDVNRQWLSADRAERVHRVVLKPSYDGRSVEVDWAETNRLRRSES